MRTRSATPEPLLDRNAESKPQENEEDEKTDEPADADGVFYPWGYSGVPALQCFVALCTLKTPMAGTHKCIF